ncbi:hypothetical protein FHS76_004171 [Ochrobactrum daejeonense]|uniref:Uncharacterized protein n=1 Tax=Brucella daejeonensis TaxID=659015 RepID=A0A7W9B1T6_9HYPH|nr:hypothetical protein [Brucella daejeonensis]
MRELQFTEQKAVAGGVTAGPNGETCTERHGNEKKK